jgi:hypothetical protein
MDRSALPGVGWFKKALKRTFPSLAIRVAQVREQMAFNRLARKPPELMWKVCAPCPERRTGAATAKLGQQLFLIGGLQSIDQTFSVVDRFDLSKGRWTDRISMPAGVAQTHLGIASDERQFIYFIAGQLGPQCRPAVADCFVLDVQTKSWGRLPSLPEARYSPTVVLWNGRLHSISGARPDRWTSACDHWSIAVAEGKALENEWREEVPIPRGGPHRASAILENKLYVFGGQEGDVKPIAGDPTYRCDWSKLSEIVYGDSFTTESGTGPWKKISPMPVAVSHIETEIVIDQYAVVVGGTQRHDRLSDLIQVYDSRADRWRIAGRLPYAMRTSAVYHDGWLYAVTGQRSISQEDLRHGEVLNTVWRAKFDPAAGWPS